MNTDRVVEALESGWTWWCGLFADVPEYPMAIAIYLLGSALLLWLWAAFARSLPRPVGGMSWVIVLAILATPTVTEGENGALAPAVVGLLLGVVTKNTPLILSSVLPMLFVVGLGFVIGFLLERLRHHNTPSV